MPAPQGQIRGIRSMTANTPPASEEVKGGAQPQREAERSGASQRPLTPGGAGGTRCEPGCEFRGRGGRRREDVERGGRRRAMGTEGIMGRSARPPRLSWVPSTPPDDLALPRLPAGPWRMPRASPGAIVREGPCGQSVPRSSGGSRSSLRANDRRAPLTEPRGHLVVRSDERRPGVFATRTSTGDVPFRSERRDRAFGRRHPALRWSR